MGLLHVDQLQAGMVLEKNLLAFNGRFLLPRGIVLTEKHIQTMKVWGVVEASVEGDLPAEPLKDAAASIPPEVLQEAGRSLETLFPSTPSTSPMKDFYSVAMERTTAALMHDRSQRGAQAQQPRSPARRLSSNIPNLSVTASDLVSRELQLASLPDVYYRIMEVINSTRSSASHIAEAVGKDTSLLSRLLRLVNSAFYGFPSKIETVTRAVAIIGTRELSTLALGVAAVQYFNDIPSEYVDMKSFWRHSVACGVYARLMASEKVGVSEERLFVSGLLHDLGKLVLFRQVPLSARNAIELALAKKIPLCEAEREILGFDHAYLGALLLREWKIPSPLENAVRFHHSPLSSSSPLDPALLASADALAMATGFSGSGSVVMPQISPEIWVETGLSAAVFQPVILQGGRQIEDITNAFLGNGGA
ncbi:MAG: metal-dependent phosphohydrolase [Synergistetes bacterium HGW-Synergistetes-2]|nr:MAG: metal-dependent phosphohydrolase [Synergistetes bacterium HGW-Synergistetes-2]